MVSVLEGISILQQKLNRGISQWNAIYQLKVLV